MTHFLLTGANGFVGLALGEALVREGYSVTGLVRRGASTASGVVEWIDGTPDFSGLAARIPAGARFDCVIHLAARVHVMHDSSSDPLAAYRATNVAGTLEVAKVAAQAGARRFVFVSSVKALGEVEPGHPWRESDPAAPADPYGVSKLEAEQALFEFGRENGMEIVIVRPPLVYGPGVRANFLQLMRSVHKGIPLPLGSVTARRSMIFVKNLVDALRFAALSPEVAGQILHVSDGQDLTVADLIRRLGMHLKTPARLIPVPVSFLRALGVLTGRAPQVARLVSPLRMDTSLIQARFGWRPPCSVDEGLAATADWYRTVH
jgi:nucleoside-diphosphate-sugar epimerase